MSKKNGAKRSPRAWSADLGGRFFWGALAMVLIAANLILPALEKKHAWKVDLTRNGVYTLSTPSEQILQNLSEDIYLYMVYSPGNEDARIEQMLREYGAASPYVHVMLIPVGMRQLLPDISLLSTEKEGIWITNQAQTLVQYFSQEDMYLWDEAGQAVAFKAEAKLTAAIQGIVQGAFCNVRLLVGHGETAGRDLQSFLQLLDMGNYQVTEWSLASSTKALDPKTDILVAVSPKADLEHSEYEAIAQFMQAGGRALLLFDRASFNTTQGVLQVYSTSLPLFSELLWQYRMQVNDDLLFSGDVRTINLRRTSLRVRPMLEGMQESEVIINEAASLDILDVEDVADVGADTQVSPLLVTEGVCFAKGLAQKVENFNFQQGTDAKGRFVVGALAARGDSRLAVLTDSLMVGDETIGISGNWAFFEGLLEELSPLTPAVSIEGKALSVPHRLLGGRTMQVLLWSLAFLLLPLGVVFAGWRLRTGKWRK